MQTIKTAAVVVLLLTILYAAYVRMTVPPPPLSPEMQDLVFDDASFDAGGFGEDDFDLGSFDAGTPTDSFEPNSFDGAPLAQSAGGQTPGGNVPGGSAGFQMSDTPAVAASFELPPANAPASAGRYADVPSSPATSAVQRLPPVVGDADITPDPGRDYPNTGDTLELPDPAAAISGVNDASAGATATEHVTTGIADAGLTNAIATADGQYATDRRREALATLSLFYESPNLSDAQRDQLLSRLDPLAGEVIYSKEHLLEKPHRVGSNETLIDIAKRYDVPHQLLANINGIDDPITVLPGTELKVVRGPFRCDVDRTHQELTLFLGDLYAGRFPISIGDDPVPPPGAYTVQEKKSQKTYYDMTGNAIPPGDPRNPYGAMWIDLGAGVALHGSPSPEQPAGAGCISVAGRFTPDLMGILSEGSTVSIR